MNLRNRFTAIFVALAVVSTTLVGVLAGNVARRHLEQGLEHRLLDVARVAGGSSALQAGQAFLLLGPGAENNPVWVDMQATLRRLVPRVVEGADIFRWQRGDSVATVLVSTAPPDSVGIGQELSWVEPYLAVEVPQALDEGEATTGLVEGDDGEVYKFGIRRLVDGVFLGVRARADYLEPLNTLRWTIAGVSLGAAALAALLGWSLAVGIVGRLETLSRAALRIQRGWMDAPVVLEGEDELARLARAMERMRTGIQKRDEQMRLMLSQVAHEIRNPLGGLELFAAAAMDTDDKDEQTRILGRVREEVGSLNAIINEFLGYARPGDSAPVLHNVASSITEAAELAKAEFAKKGATLSLDLPPGGALALADPQQVKRLVLNLLRNAAQAGTEVRADLATMRGEVRIRVRDNGPGVPNEIRDRIFEPFVGDKEQGAGLGLAIAQKLAEANQGRIELSPPPDEGGRHGAGAEFKVYFRGPEDLAE